MSDKFSPEVFDGRGRRRQARSVGSADGPGGPGTPGGGRRGERQPPARRELPARSRIGHDRRRRGDGPVRGPAPAPLHAPPNSTRCRRPWRPEAPRAARNWCGRPRRYTPAGACCGDGAQSPARHIVAGIDVGNHTTEIVLARVLDGDGRSRSATARHRPGAARDPGTRWTERRRCCAASRSTRRSTPMSWCSRRSVRSTPKPLRWPRPPSPRSPCAQLAQARRRALRPVRGTRSAGTCRWVRWTGALDDGPVIDLG